MAHGAAGIPRAELIPPAARAVRVVIFSEAKRTAHANDRVGAVRNSQKKGEETRLDEETRLHAACLGEFFEEQAGLREER